MTGNKSTRSEPCKQIGKEHKMAKLIAPLDGTETENQFSAVDINTNGEFSRDQINARVAAQAAQFNKQYADSLSE